jgi:hypothetical protein
MCFSSYRHLTILNPQTNTDIGYEIAFWVGSAFFQTAVKRSIPCRRATSTRTICDTWGKILCMIHLRDRHHTADNTTAPYLIASQQDLDRLSRRHVEVRTDLSIYMMAVEMHTWSPDWKRVIIIIPARCSESHCGA